jgi:hypothetical protein
MYGYPGVESLLQILTKFFFTPRVTRVYGHEHIIGNLMVYNMVNLSDRRKLFNDINGLERYH